MKKIIYFLSLSFLMLSCSNDETTDTDEIDNGIFEIQINQGGDFQSYETVITTSLTGSSFTDCEGNEVDNLILYSLTNIESCSIKANNTATQMTGSILLKNWIAITRTLEIQPLMLIFYWMVKVFMKQPKYAQIQRLVMNRLTLT